MNQNTSLVVLRRDGECPRLGFWHHNELTTGPNGELRITVIPDSQGPYFTTICAFDYFNAKDWPERMIESLEKTAIYTDTPKVPSGVPRAAPSPLVK